jgi:inhibitor of KinA sporulation pathway (predicted exonuclease)
MKTTNEILIVDLEATCWDNDRIPHGQKVDIIEIGICKLNLTSKTISQKQSIYVIPERSEINRFCTKLTGITPQLIEEKGIYFEEACEKIRDEYDSNRSHGQDTEISTESRLLNNATGSESKILFQKTT